MPHSSSPRPRLRLHNSATRQIEVFIPLDAQNIRLYFCGPTVYDRVHLGNLRAMLSADILVRVLREMYPRVTFVRNITDIDDKIIQRAQENNEDITHLTQRTTQDFHDDLAALCALTPDIEPKATEHIDAMLALVAKLIEKGHAYEAEGKGKGNVLFDISSFKEYGALSGRSIDDSLAGARVEISSYKRHPADFILWKPSNKDEPGWESPYGRGRPGWHIECSAMSAQYLGENFDIHGGGNDLLFPHHENERAQSLCGCTHPQEEKPLFANYWIHTGMLLSHGEKMSKSLGNFHTIREALEHAPAEALRFLYLTAHYRSTLDFSWEKLEEAKSILDRFYRALETTKPQKDATYPHEFLHALCEDLNTPQALSLLHKFADQALKNVQEGANHLYHSGRLLGLFTMEPSQWFQSNVALEHSLIDKLIEERVAAKKEKNFARADEIRAYLADYGIILEDGPQGTIWRKE